MNKNKPSASNFRQIALCLAIAVLGLAASCSSSNATTTSDAGADTSQPGATTAPIEQIAAVGVEGNALESMPEGAELVLDAASDPMGGVIAPTLTGTDFEGNEVTIGQDGKAKAIYFVAHWCPHCQAEVPIVQSLINQGATPDGMDVYAVSTAVDETRGNFPVDGWLKSEGFSATVLRDDANNQALGAYGPSGFPYVVYLDAEHRVVARSRGSLSAEKIEELWALTVE